MTNVPRTPPALLIAALATGALASVVQTHINLAALVELGGAITPSIRVAATLEDLARFGPVLAAVALISLLPCLIAGHFANKIPFAAWRTPVLLAVAVTSLWFLFWLMRSVIPMPAIAATRTPLDHLLMALTGATGGLTYGYLTTASRWFAPSFKPMHNWYYHLATVACLVVLGLSFKTMAPSSDPGPEIATPESYQVHEVVTGLSRPWSVAFLPDGRFLITEMGGKLLLVDQSGIPTSIALEGLPQIYSNRGIIGLMEVALDTDFARNHTLYLTMGYGDAGANGVRLVRAQLIGGRLSNVRELFSSTPKSGLGNNGGRIAFLQDGSLVMTVGDGSARREEAQNLTNTLGTVVRVDKEGNPPQDNPFLDQPNAAPEIYTLGHRNPQGIAVDPATGELFVTEHGPRGGDEINCLSPGSNYGWPLVTKGIDYPYSLVSPFQQLDGYQDPILTWTPSIAPSGLAIYRGEAFPDWQGDMLVPALKERGLRRVLRDKGNVVGQQLLLSELEERIRDVKVAADGSVYVLTDGAEAKLLRLTPARGS